MKLTPRLKVIADFVPEGSKVADIGTDHAYIPVYLAREKSVDRLIASDINEGPLDSAKSYISASGLDGRIQIRLGNGMKVLKRDEVDTVIIAGMGGLLISEIMEDSKEICESVERFILQSMVGMVELRQYLESNGYLVSDEKLVKEGKKLYQILLVEKGNEKVEDDIYYEFSKKLVENKDPLFEEFVSRKIKKLDSIIENINNKGSDENKNRAKMLTEKKEKLVGVLDYVIKSNN